MFRYNWIPNIFSIDIDNIFTSIDVKIPHDVYDLVRFFSVMAVPLVCLLLYALFKSAKMDDWIDAYITNWRHRRNRAVGTLLLLMVLAAVGLLFFDYPTSFDRVTAGKIPDPVVNTLIAISWGVFFVFFLVWYSIVATFRWKYRKEQRRDAVRTKFLAWFLRIKRRVIRVVLFFVTVSYMPVARVVLDNWAGQYVALLRCRRIA